MACGLPAVVSDVGDITDLAIEGVTAKVVQYPYRTEEFAQAVIDLLNSDHERYELGLNARKLVKASFSIEAEAKRWQNIFKHVLEGRRLKPDYVVV